MPSGENLGGPSASAGSIKAGGAFFEITGKDGVTKVLAKIEGEIKKFDKSIKRVGNVAGVGGFLGGLIGGAGGFVGGSTLTGVLARFGSTLGSELVEGALNAGVMRVELEKSVKLAGELQQAMRKQFSREDEEREGLGTVTERVGRMREDLERAETNAVGQAQALQTARQALKDMAGEDLETTNWNPLNWFGESELKMLKQNLTDAEGLYRGTKDRIKQLNDDIRKSEATLEREIHNRFIQQRSKEFFGIGSGVGGALKGALKDAIPKIQKELTQMQFADALKDPFGRRPFFGKFGGMLNELRGVGFMKKEEIEQMWQDQNLQRSFRMGGAAVKGLGGLLNTMLGAGIGKLGPALEPLLKGSEIRTGFGGQSAMQRFGFGENVAQLSLKAQQLIADNTKRENVAKAVADGLKDLVLR